MTLNRVVRFALSDAGATPAAGINVTDAEVAAKREAGAIGLAIRGSFGVYGICHDWSGNMYVADALRHIILRIDEGGRISIFAGYPSVAGDVLGANNDARFNGPKGVACDKSGNIYVADSGNNKIKVITGGTVRLVAGSTAGLVDGVGSAAQFKNPVSVAVDRSGILYVADENNHAIRKIRNGGDVLTIAGNGTAGDSENVEANGQTATFSSPKSVAVDAAANIYVLDTGNKKIKKIVPKGWVYLHSGSGVQGDSLGTSPSWGYTCQYDDLADCDCDESGNLYVIDLETGLRSGSRIVKVDYDGRPGNVVDFNTSQSNDLLLKGIMCSPGQKIFVTITDATINSSSSSSSTSSESVGNVSSSSSSSSSSQSSSSSSESVGNVSSSSSSSSSSSE